MAAQSAAMLFWVLCLNLISYGYSLPAKEIDTKNQKLALRRFAPQRLILHWEGSI